MKVFFYLILYLLGIFGILSCIIFSLEGSIGIGLLFLITTIILFYFIFRENNDNKNSSQEYISDSTSQHSITLPLREEFSTIITRLSNDGQAVIFKENSKSVSWGVANMGGKVIFSIELHGNNTIAVSWLSESPFFGIHSKSWEFPRNMDQDSIVDEMNYGIQRVLRNGL